MRIQYGAIRPQYDINNTDLITFSLGNGNLSLGNIYFYVSAKNNVGYNYLSASKLIEYGPNSAITITLKEDLWRSAESITEIIISASLDNNAQNAYRIASISYPSISNFPYTITLNEDEQLLINEVVNSTLELPTMPINGMGRGVQDLGNFYVYYSHLTEWIQIGTLSTYIDNITTLPGCNASILEVVSDDLLEPIITYEFDGSKSKSVRYWIVADSNETINAGNRLGLNIFVNELVKNQLFKNKLKIIFRGYADTLTGELDTTDYTGDFDMLFINSIIPYTYTKQPSLALQKDLAPNQAFVIDVYLETNYIELQDYLPYGSTISIVPFFYPQSGEYNSVGQLIGDCIFNEGNYRRIYPSNGLTVIAQEGSGMVDNFQFPLQSKSYLTVRHNQANQLISINGNGSVFLIEQDGTIEDTEALRAIISTESGNTPLSNWSNLVTITEGDQLNLQINLPTDTNGKSIVRTDYPDKIKDILIDFNILFINIIIKKDNLYYLIERAISTNTIQNINISNLEGATQLTNLSDLVINTEDDFGLFNLPSLNLTNTTGGNLESGIYQICVSYKYDGSTISKISHKESDGCIVEFPVTLGQLIQRFYYWGATLTPSQMRNLTTYTHGLELKMEMGTELKDMVFNKYNTEPDDNVTSIKPNNILNTSPGRFIRKGINFTILDYIQYIIALS